MAIDIDKSVATKILNQSFKLCSESPVTTCKIKDTIDFVMVGKNCLTYRYIMLTALLAKATDPSIDILSLQAGDSSEGAYDARSLASKVVYPFQKRILGNILDGSNSDPLVNKPGRFLRLSKNNPAAGGDPQKALSRLCEELPKVQTSVEAQDCVAYMVSLLLEKKKVRDQKQSLLRTEAVDMSVFQIRDFFSDLLDQGFGGAALVLVATALYHVQFPSDHFQIIAHPVNQSGSSKRQFSDLDLLRDHSPFMGTELKDKPFTAADVDHAAETAHKAGASSLLFIAGRQSAFASQPPTYFSRAREKYASKGLYVGVSSIDALMDFVLSVHVDLNVEDMMDIVSRTAESIGALEAQMWIYDYMTES